MAKRITDLRTTTKTETTSRQYLLISDITSRESTKIALNDVFPALQSGKETGTVSAGATGSIQDLFVGGGVGSTATNTNKSTLIFKGLKPEVIPVDLRVLLSSCAQIRVQQTLTSRTLLWL